MMSRFARIGAFWSLIILSLSVIIIGFAANWYYLPRWGQVLWQSCQIGFEILLDNLPQTWQLLLPFMLAIIIIRGVASLIYQFRMTYRLVNGLNCWQTNPTSELLPLLKTLNLPLSDVIYLDLAVPRAFCIGFLHPRICLTTGLVKLLSSTELTAVIAHEAHHYHQRDPLRLLTSRTIQYAFGCLPIMNKLVTSAELQQEIDADQAAVRHLQDDLPLLTALQKLLHNKNISTIPTQAVYSSFNVTEARLQRLVYPTESIQSVPRLSTYLFNLGVMVMVSTILLGSLTFTVWHQPEITTCQCESTAHMTGEP